MNYDVSICTPLYNRAYKILDLYESIKLQTNKNFEWIIIDDGSTDDILMKIEKIRKENLIMLKYKQKENGGKHTAINEALEIAEGKLFFIVDSDDVLTDNAIELIISEWEKIELSGEDLFIGVSGNRGYSNKKVIGDSLFNNHIDCTALELRYKYNISGDKAEAFKTEILKKYLFPIFKNEKFLTEAVVWNRIACDGYKLRWINEIIYITEYLEDGLTKKYDSLMANNINGTKLYYSELLNIKNVIDEDKRDIARTEYVKYLFINKTSLKEIIELVQDLKKTNILKGYIFATIYKLKLLIKKVIKK
ncbi:glycosyltransferase family 2 protein [Clostridium tertium]|uniref:glycosyltransferase family 2 protein n=1 Tax=Clostridium tertium TaxID=1559 RepID=UPI000BE237D3|nr:glycosyltransferase family 2 protein [Clostridium tertium]